MQLRVDGELLDGVYSTGGAQQKRQELLDEDETGGAGGACGGGSATNGDGSSTADSSSGRGSSTGEGAPSGGCGGGGGGGGGGDDVAHSRARTVEVVPWEAAGRLLLACPFATKLPVLRYARVCFHPDATAACFLHGPFGLWSTAWWRVVALAARMGRLSCSLPPCSFLCPFSPRKNEGRPSSHRRPGPGWSITTQPGPVFRETSPVGPPRNAGIHFRGRLESPTAKARSCPLLLRALSRPKRNSQIHSYRLVVVAGTPARRGERRARAATVPSLREGQQRRRRRHQ